MDAGSLVPYIFLGVLFLVALIFLTRAIFSIPAILRYFKAMVKLNALQARAKGVPEEQIQQVLSEAKGDNEKL